MLRKAIALVLAGMLLAGCGSTPEERGVSGAGIGASAGAIVGAVTGLSVLQGAVLGAVAGGLTGAVTNKDTINMGEPAWKRRANTDGGTAPAAAQAADGDMQASAGDVRTIQSGLRALGYDSGGADGVAGTRTREAIRAYQKDKKLLVDGRPTAELAQHIDTEIKRLVQLSKNPSAQ